MMDGPDKYTTYSALGAICSLMIQSNVHRRFRIADFDWLVLPPLKLGQVKLFIKDNSAVGYASWAFLSESTAHKILSLPRAHLEFDDWNSGPDAWIIDMAAVSGEMAEIKRQLLTETFANQRVRTFKPKIINGESSGLIGVDF